MPAPQIEVTPDQVRQWGGKTLDAVAAADLQRVINAATAYVLQRVGVWRAAWPDLDKDALAQAVVILTARWWARHSSPNGTIGFGADGAVVRFSRQDPDVEALLQPFDDVAGNIA